MEIWEGNLILSNGQIISDIHLSASAKSNIIPPNARLQFLAFVDPSRVPLHYFHGPRLDVWTTSEETEGWFGDVLIRDDEDAWWHDARPESPIGVLAAVNYSSEDSASNAHAGITEVLFTAARDNQSAFCPPTPPQSSQGIAETFPEVLISLQAYFLNSNVATDESFAPHSPTSTDAGIICGTFLPDCPAAPDEPTKPTSKPTTTLKRKSLADTFEEADVLRKRVRSTPGDSVQAASAAGPSMPTLKELKTNALEGRGNTSRLGSAAGPTHVPMQTRPLSRSSSISSLGGIGPRSSSASRGAVGTTTEMRKSGLGRIQSMSSDLTPTVDPDIETKNKDIVSRLVMAGMRLYGLSQSKAKKSERHQRRSSLAPAVAMARAGSQSRHSSPAPADTQAEDDEAARKDEEWKLVYHSTYRGATFAFRGHMASTPLQPHTEILRQVVDKLLALYCSDPLAAGLPGMGKDKVTPGGRKAFATPRDEEGESPFAIGLGSQKAGDGDAITPSLRKKRELKTVSEKAL